MRQNYTVNGVSVTWLNNTVTLEIPSNQYEVIEITIIDKEGVHEFIKDIFGLNLFDKTGAFTVIDKLLTIQADFTVTYLEERNKEE